MLNRAQTHVLRVTMYCAQAMLGRAKVAEVRHNLAGALEGLTEVSVRFAWFMPALVEKTRLLLAQVRGTLFFFGHVATRLLLQQRQHV